MSDVEKSRYIDPRVFGPGYGYECLEAKEGTLRLPDMSFVSGRSGDIRRFGWEISDGQARPISRDIATLLRVDYDRADRDYWIGLKRFIYWLGECYSDGQLWAHVTYKIMRANHHALKRREWYQVVPCEVKDWAYRELAREQSGRTCCDNDRVARVGNTAQMRRYRRQKMAGCCGSRDWRARGPDGRDYLIGFNYGH